jgi:leucine-rich repeat-containing protein 49
LSIDNRQLTACPVLEGEERLRLLNYQNNNIQTITNVGNLPNLIFLDLYNNSIKSMMGLQTVTQLRVLMLGKNKISKVFLMPSLFIARVMF